MTTWIDFVRRVSNGDPVEAGVFNQTLDALIQRDQYLKEALELAMSGRSLIDFDVEIDAAAVPGTPVYIDADGDDVYTPAQALIADSGNTIGQLQDEGFIKGVVLMKTSSQRGHVVVGGFVPSSVDFTAVIDTGVATAGHYFLSATTPGELTLIRSAAAIYVGQLLSNGQFILSRNDDVSAEDHIHFKFTLTNRPAVANPSDLTPAVPAVNGTWDISGVVDGNERGWLNAGHPNLGPAPAGAVFGYNIPEEPALDGVFPPVPVLAIFATLGRDVVNQDQLIVDANGIWWLNDEYDQVPWPVDYDQTGVESDLCLYLASLTTDTVSRGVSTLRANPGSVLPLSVLNLQGDASTVGDLQIAVTELLLAGSTTAKTGSAVKSIVGRTVNVGPVVDSIQIASAGLTASASVNDGGLLSGSVQLSLDAGTINQFLTPRVPRLVGAQIDQFREFSYESLPANRDTSIVYQFTVPSQGVPAAANLRLRLALLGRGASSLPDLIITQRSVLPSDVTAVALPSAWSAVETVSGVTLDGDETLIVESATTVPVQPGTEILIRVERLGATDGYASPVGILRTDAVLEA